MYTPIVIAAFGTTSRALETYDFIDAKLKKRFPDHEILWSYSSRMVKDRMKKSGQADLKHPHQVLEALKEKGHPWAVVQSLHLMCGHEFYRLVQEAGSCDIRTAIGLPLLCDPDDYQRVVEAIGNTVPGLRDKNAQAAGGEALIMVGHGSDHPSWASYLALHHMLREKYANAWLGVLEEGYPSMQSIINDLKAAGFKKARLIPFLLVAGVHFEEDLIGNENSWKRVLEAQGISVTFEGTGLGLNPSIIDIFADHIQAALDIVPTQGSI